VSIRVTIELDLDIDVSEPFESHYRKAYLARYGRWPAPTDGIVDAAMSLLDWAACDLPGVTVIGAGGGRPLFPTIPAATA
jgi:hypothetical protein